MKDEKEIKGGKPTLESMHTLYREVCENHRAITDFRAKLLTLLPLASGTGISLLLTGKNNPLDTTHLIAIGIFGFFVTLGLFLHELRGIRHCGELIILGKSLEEDMQLKSGQFVVEDDYYHKQSGLRKFHNKLVGPVGAAWVIYPIVALAWLYVSASQFCWS